MLAIPLDTKDSNTISKLYGKAPYFALLDTKNDILKIVENEVIGKGPKSADFLKKHNVKATIFYHMGEGVYNSFQNNLMDVYTVNYKEDNLEEIRIKFLSNMYKKVDSSNYKTLLDPGENETCTCGCETKSKGKDS